MTFRYKYLGDLPTVFIHLHNEDGTWTPSKNDEIDWHEAVQHPLLELVSHKDDAPPVEVEELVEEEHVNEPAVPEITESPVSADDKEN